MCSMCVCVGVGGRGMIDTLFCSVSYFFTMYFGDKFLCLCVSCDVHHSCVFSVCWGWGTRKISLTTF